jgi:hypothetical protein
VVEAFSDFLMDLPLIHVGSSNQPDLETLAVENGAITSGSNIGQLVDRFKSLRRRWKSTNNASKVGWQVFILLL